MQYFQQLTESEYIETTCRYQPGFKWNNKKSGIWRDY